MQRKFLLSGLLAMALGLTTAKAQLYSYTNDLGGVPAVTATNTTGSSMTQVNGALSSPGCPDGFNSNKFAEATTYVASRPAVEFSLSPNTGYQINITSLSVDARRNNKGPVTWRLAYSVDGGASWIDNGADLSVTATACASSNTLTWDIPDFAMVTPIYVRIYPYAANSNLNGIATIKNVTLSGFVTFADVDADGYTSNVDCDDFNPAINPAATEVCDGVDNDCDGDIDEGLLLTFFADADADGFGDAGNSTMACTLPAGYTTDNTDCNDGNAAINPSAMEICNGLDDDCDGPADEDLPYDAWYADADGDTYGDDAMPLETCDGAPAGYVADNTDCNDADAGVNPGAAEICNGLDENCNGDIDEGLTFETWYADADGDGFGDAGISTTTCDGAPAGYVADNTDCADADVAVNPGATEVCNGIDDDCDGNVDEGLLLTSYADADGDSFGDAAISNTGCDVPAGYVLNDSDCDDASNTVYPGAPEICDNGIDEDCDGVIDLTATIAADGVTTFCLGGSVTLNSTTAGAGLSYQWQKNGNPIAGATNSSYVVTIQGNYRCVVSKPSCTSTSSAITVTVNLNPNATIAALDGLDLCGKSFVRLRGNNGTGLSYQWYLDGSPIAGATTQLYYATATGSYQVQVTSAAGCSTLSAASVVFTSCRQAEFAGEPEMVILPNPSRGIFDLQLTLPTELNANARVQILNMAGQAVQDFHAEVAAGLLNAHIEMTPVAGAYLVVVQVNGAVYTERLMITE